MSAITKPIRTKNSRKLHEYLETEKEGGAREDRVAFEDWQNCTPGHEEAQFRAQREAYGQQGRMHRRRGNYVEPDDPARATHIRVGKNWREAKPGEQATHVRHARPGPDVVKSDEAVHQIYSFDSESVDLNNREQCQRAFDAVRTFEQERFPGLQIRWVGHTDSVGSTGARARGEGGKFHVHAARNIVVFKEMEVDGVRFRPGQRLSSPITDVNSHRRAWDQFLEQRGHEFGLGPQDRTKLPEVGSAGYMQQRITDQDFHERERGKVTPADRARRGIETAFAALDADREAFARLDHDAQINRFVDECDNTGDVSVTVRSTKKDGLKVRSFTPAGTKKPMSKALGERYTTTGVQAQLDAIAAGRWKPVPGRHAHPVPRRQAAPVAQTQTPATDYEIGVRLPLAMEELAENEQRAQQVDEWIADSVERAQDAQRMGYWSIESTQHSGLTVEERWRELGVDHVPGAEDYRRAYEAMQQERSEAIRREVRAEAERREREATERHEVDEWLQDQADREGATPMEIARCYELEPDGELSAGQYHYLHMRLTGDYKRLTDDQVQNEKERWAQLRAEVKERRAEEERRREQERREAEREVERERIEPEQPGRVDNTSNGQSDTPERATEEQREPHDGFFAPPITAVHNIFGETPLVTSNKGGYRIDRFGNQKNMKLLAEVQKVEKDGSAWVDFQVSALDERANGKTGLHLVSYMSGGTRLNVQKIDADTHNKLVEVSKRNTYIDRYTGKMMRPLTGDLRPREFGKWHSSFTVDKDTMRPWNPRPVGIGPGGSVQPGGGKDPDTAQVEANTWARVRHEAQVKELHDTWDPDRVRQTNKNDRSIAD